jgi:hypothetical protein
MVANKLVKEIFAAGVLVLLLAFAPSQRAQAQKSRC